MLFIRGPSYVKVGESLRSYMSPGVKEQSQFLVHLHGLGAKAGNGGLQGGVGRTVGSHGLCRTLASVPPFPFSLCSSTARVCQSIVEIAGVASAWSPVCSYQLQP